MRALILLLAMLGACTAPPAEPTGGEGQATSPPRGVASSAGPVAPVPLPMLDLAGEYRVAGVNGADVNQPYAITASISAERIHVVADCINLAWRYEQQGDTVSTERVAVEGCGRGLTVAEEAVTAAFDSARTVARTPGNALEFRGPGHAVTLFSQ